MAFTNDEIQSIVSAVLSSLQTNSKTIEQLTPVTMLSDSDVFEIAGGRKVSYKVLKDLIISLTTSKLDILKTLINKNELDSVSITTTDCEASLNIYTGAKIITTTIPISTTNNVGMMSADDKVKLNAAYDSAESKGKPQGLAPLDADGKVPARFIPGSMDNVVEFNAMVEGITLQTKATTKRSTDADCMVVYNKDTDCFVLAVSTLRGRQETSNSEQETGGTGIIQDPFFYYSRWNSADAERFGLQTTEGSKPIAGKIYTCTSMNKTYRWESNSLVVIGSDLALGHVAGTAFPGDEGVLLQQEIAKNRMFIDIWNSACRRYGTYNAETGYFELNGLTDITYTEAVKIYNASHPLYNADGRCYSHTFPDVRTFIPSVSFGQGGRNTFESCPLLESIRFVSGYGDTIRPDYGNNNFSLRSCKKLHTVLGVLDFVRCNHAVDAFLSCEKLRDIQVKNLHTDMKLPDSPLISLASLQYMVSNANNSTGITINVHADVYAKLTGDTSYLAASALTPEEAARWQQLANDAKAKQISFVTA